MSAAVAAAQLPATERLHFRHATEPLAKTQPPGHDSAGQVPTPSGSAQCAPLYTSGALVLRSISSVKLLWSLPPYGLRSTGAQPVRVRQSSNRAES